MKAERAGWRVTSRRLRLRNLFSLVLVADV